MTRKKGRYWRQREWPDVDQTDRTKKAKALRGLRGYRRAVQT
jgi:hypothetical protein